MGEHIKRLLMILNWIEGRDLRGIQENKYIGFCNELDKRSRKVVVGVCPKFHVHITGNIFY